MKQSAWWLDRSKGSSQKGMTVVTMHWVAGLSVSRNDGYVWAAHTCNRFIYMLDFYEASKVSELLFYKFNQLSFWTRCTWRLLNSKLPKCPQFTDFERNKHVSMSLSILNDVIVATNNSCSFNVFIFTISIFKQSYKQGISLELVTGPMAHWKLQTVKSKTCTVHIALHPRGALLTAYFSWFRSQHCSNQVLFGLAFWNM